MSHTRKSQMLSEESLQAVPTVSMFYGARHRDPARAEAALKADVRQQSAAPEPVGELLGVLIATPRGWVPDDTVTVGTFEIEAEPDREYLLSCVPPSSWLAAETIEIRVHRFKAEVHDDTLPATSKLEFRTKASRRTAWSPRDHAPGDILVDDRRGLALRADGSHLVWDWYHARQEDVFSEMVREGRAFMRVVLVKAPKPLGAPKDWFEAQETPFPAPF